MLASQVQISDSFNSRLTANMGQGLSTVSNSRVQHAHTQNSVQRGQRSENLPNVGDIDPGSPSLMEKFRQHYREGHPKGSKVKVLSRCLFQFQAITQLYMTLNYLIPYVFSEYDDMSQYYWKVLTCYVFAMGEANWLCSVCYSSVLPDFKDRPSLDFNDWFQNPPDTFGEKGHIKPMNDVDKNGLQWKYCTKCERYKPPRTHHCPFCRSCIIRRDHHCHLIGACIGHYNQRYFVVFCFLGIITGSVGFLITYSYLKSLPDAQTWTDYVIPWTFYKFLLGYFSWQFVLLTFHAYMLFTFGILSFMYFNSQMFIIIMGKTLVEVKNNIDVKVTSSFADNLRLVFGDYWMLNFLFPAQIIFKQRHDGIHFENLKYPNNTATMQNHQD